MRTHACNRRSRCSRRSRLVGCKAVDWLAGCVSTDVVSCRGRWGVFTCQYVPITKSSPINCGKIVTVNCTDKNASFCGANHWAQFYMEFQPTRHWLRTVWLSFWYNYDSEAGPLIVAANRVHKVNPWIILKFFVLLTSWFHLNEIGAIPFYVRSKPFQQSTVRFRTAMP